VCTRTPSFVSNFNPASEKAFGQRRQDAISRFDEINLDVLLRIDSVDAIRDELARRVVQLRCQLRPGGACADDCDLELFGPQWFWLRMPANVGVHEPAMEALGLDRRIERDCMLAYAGVPKSLLRLPMAMMSVS
jgi:hypothetical protein